MWTRERLKTNGRIAFKRNYWPCVGAAFIVSLITSIGGSGNAGRNASESIDYYYNEGSVIAGNYYSFPLIGMLTGGIMISLAILAILLVVFVGAVIEMGGKRFFILNKTEMPSVGTIFDGFRSGHYGNIVLTMFLRRLYTFLWSLLLIIPGVIKYYEYLMVPYILAENPGMDQKEAFAISKRMMNGQKMDAFFLSLSFLGWDILSLITCGIVGVFYVTPYKEATFSELYAFNKAAAYSEGYIR